MKRFFLPLFTASALLLITSISPLWAEDQDDVLSAHFVTGWRTDVGTHISGLKLELAKGWKTYWRAPGEAGIPAQFNWASSINLKAVEVHWPRPQVFELQSMQSIGYKDAVTLPFTFTPIDPSKAIEIKANIDLGVCHDICLPAHLILRETLPPNLGAAHSKAIVLALADQPKSILASSLNQISCSFFSISGGMEIKTRLNSPLQGEVMALAIETDQPAWVSDAALTQTGNNLAAVNQIFPTEQAFFINRTTLRLTVITQDQAIEIIGCPAG
jgi:DsbC/DsbD-like thiol-disulfide interchange protein